MAYEITTACFARAERETTPATYLALHLEMLGWCTPVRQLYVEGATVEACREAQAQRGLCLGECR